MANPTHKAALSEVVIAVRGGAQAKSRCAPLLDAATRQHLILNMLEDMLAALAGAPGVGRIWVATPTPAAAALARVWGAAVIDDGDAEDLSACLHQARREIARERPAAWLVLLPGDLPAVSSAELSALARPFAGVRLAPAAADGGTNALAMRADCALKLQFGPDSFTRHLAAAATLGEGVDVVRSPGLALDMDRPADLLRLIETSQGRTADLVRNRASLATRVSA